MLCLTPFLRRLRQRSGHYLITARQGTPRPCLHLCCYLGTGLASLLGGGIQAAPWPGANTSTADGRVPPWPQGHCRRRAALLPSTPQRALLFLATVSVYDAADLPWDCPRAEIQCGRPGLRGHSTPLCSFSPDGDRPQPYSDRLSLRVSYFADPPSFHILELFKSSI